MSVTMIMRWNGVSIEQYDKVRSIVNWEGVPADGGNIHICTHDGTALRVVDVWETPEQFNNFVETRLMPGVQQAGITTQPEVEIYPTHAVFAPIYESPQVA